LRVYADVDEQTLSKIEQITDEKGISKREFFNQAIDHFISKDDQNGSKLDQLMSEFDQLKIKHEQALFEMRHFDDTLKNRDSEIEFLRSTVHQLSEKLPKALPEFTEEDQQKRKHHWWHFW
jgi:hypothetical protein